MPWTRTRARARRAEFLRQFNQIAGPDGVSALANEGHFAHEVSDELHAIAQQNTPATVKAQRKARSRHRLVVALATLVLLAALGWIGLRVVDFVTSAAGTQPSAVTAPNVAALVLAIAAVVVLLAASRRRRKRAWY